MSNIEILAGSAPVDVPVPPVSGTPKRQSESVNLIYGLGYVIGAIALAIPPVGILIILITYRAHKKYRATYTPPAGS